MSARGRRELILLDRLNFYRATAPFQGTMRRFRSGKLGSANYGLCLTIGTNGEGLYLAVFFPFAGRNTVIVGFVTFVIHFASFVGASDGARTLSGPIVP